MKKGFKIKVSFAMVLLSTISAGQELSKDTSSYFMKDELNTIETYLKHKDSLNQTISKVSVAWHIDHSLKTINAISDSLRASKPSSFKGRLNVLRMFSLGLGYIPRGKAQSPPWVLPPDTIYLKDIRAQLRLARKNLAEIQALNPKANFNHPVFKQLNKRQSKRFMRVHTRHHLKIIKDILKQ